MRLSLRWGVRHSREDKTIWSKQGLGGGTADAPAGLEAFDVDAVPAL
ncbi:hypothetical protein ACWGS5_28865 [Streptomyces albidoflavus]|nr:MULTISPECIES: hypothetical protein [unclassified Streptomyces]MCG5117807.1 hypothetical protein [Streptomyces sp. T7(2022)]MDH6189984.1 hypothetical protein [Streptomyces sp. CZ24]